MNCPSCGRENPTDASYCMACATSLVPPAEPALSPSDLFPVSSGFVGRQREMGELRTALEDAFSGRGRLVMLAGEPGIGKTRTAQELASHAEALGGQALSGRRYEEEGGPPYWPWAQIIQSYIQQHTPEQLGSMMGPGAVDIADIVPNLRAKLPDLEPPSALEPGPAPLPPFRLHHHLPEERGPIPASDPGLDDLHWADKPSLLLLRRCCAAWPLVRAIGILGKSW